MEADEYLSVDDVGKAVGKSPRTVRRWCQRGRLHRHARKSGRSYLIDPAAVERLRQESADESKDGARAEEADTDPESSEDRDLAKGQVANAVTESDEDTGQTNGHMQEEIDQLRGQVEELESEIDQLGRMHRDRIAGVEDTSHRVWATAENLKFVLGIYAVVFMMAVGVLSVVFVHHHEHYAHVPELKRRIQQAHERTEKEALSKRLDELAQAVESRDGKSSRGLIVVREDVRPIPKDAEQKAVIADSKRSGRPSQQKASEPVLLDWDSIGR